MLRLTKTKILSWNLRSTLSLSSQDCLHLPFTVETKVAGAGILSRSLRLICLRLESTGEEWLKGWPSRASKPMHHSRKARHGEGHGA